VEKLEMEPSYTARNVKCLWKGIYSIYKVKWCSYFGKVW
jgi:hypothetical protein